MPTIEEKSAFAQRLQIALKAIYGPNNQTVKGAVDLAQQFNLKHQGKMGISTQAAHKWLKGQVMPKADKIKALAEWLDVNEFWLQYGSLPKSEVLKTTLISLLPTSVLIEKIDSLSIHQRYLIEELVKQFDRNAFRRE